MKIVWVSRHAPTASQTAALQQLAPGHEFVRDTEPFSSARDIVERFKALGGDEMVVVAPWTVLNRLIKSGINPIIPVTKDVPCTPNSEIVIGRGKNLRCREFLYFGRCTKLNMEVAKIESL